MPNAFKIYAGEYNVASPLGQPQLHDINGFPQQPQLANDPSFGASPFFVEQQAVNDRSPQSSVSLAQRSPYTYYDSSIAKSNYVANKSTIRHVKIADD